MRKTRRILVRRSQIHGKGVFAAVRIPAGSRIVEYKGVLMTERAADEKYPDDGSPHTFLFLLDGEMVIDANRQGNAARWINHGCKPNCEPVEEEGRVFIEAIRDIRAGEELSYDYNLVLQCRHTPAMKRFYACRCGAPACRGTMLGEKD